MDVKTIAEVWNGVEVADCIRVDMDTESAIMRYQPRESFIILNSFGAYLWDQKEKGTEFDALVESIKNIYQISNDAFLDDIYQFLQNLIRKRLVYLPEDRFTHVIGEERGNSGCSQVGNGVNYEKIFSYYLKRQLPFKVFLELTYNCNLRCNHCYLGSDISNELQYLSTDEIMRILDQLSEAGVRDIVLTGGEIGTRSDLIPIVKYAVSKRFMVTLLTNATLLDGVYDELVELNIYDVRVSMYGSKEYHDAFVNRPGAFEKSLRFLEKLNVDKGIGSAVCILTNENYQYMDQLSKLFDEKGIQFVLNPFLFPTIHGDMSPVQYRLSNGELMSFIRRYDKKFGGSTCTAGISKFRITPHGDVNPCEMLRHVSLGNIREHSFQEIMNSKARQEWIRTFEEVIETRDCKHCEKKPFCGNCIGVAYLETGSYDGISQYACHAATMQYEKNAVVSV